MKAGVRETHKNLLNLLIAAVCLLQCSACMKGGNGKIDLSGVTLDLNASSEFFDTTGEHVLSYMLTTAVMKDDGDIIFAHSFTNHSDYRITRITCEFYYYTDTGAVIAHKKLDRLLNEMPVEPGTTYTYYSTNNFGGAVPNSMAAHITCADTELETPILPEPNADSAFFDFFTDGRYDRLKTAFVVSAPVELRFKRDNSAEITVTDPDAIRKVYEAMERIHVGAETGSSSGGQGAYYTFVTGDGSEYTVSFVSETAIRYGSKEYAISGGDTLFSIELKEDEYSRTVGNGYEDGKVD